jgi:cell division septal protein FtsQ
MRLRRSVLPQTRRQKLRVDDLAKPPSTFSYRASRSEQERGTGRQAQRESVRPASNKFGHFWLQRFGFVILLLAAAASAVNIITLSASAKVVPLVSDGNRSFLRPTEVYENAASQQLKLSIWNHNKITVDTAKLSQQLLSQFPELSSVSVTVPLLAHRLLVYVQSAQPALVLVTTSNGSFVIDTTGKALVSGGSTAVLRQPQLPLLNDQSGLRLQPNHQALPAASVGFVQTVIAQLAARQFAVSSMTLPAAASELDVQLAGQPYFVKFNLESDNPRGEAGTFLATIAQLRRQNTVPAKYIDVRVDGRAYYQ